MGRRYDPIEFCEPKFIVGNGLLMSPGNLLYDRIYCGAACPPEHAQLMRNMLNVGGVLVMPHDNQVCGCVVCVWVCGCVFVCVWPYMHSQSRVKLKQCFCLSVSQSRANIKKCLKQVS